AEGKDLTALMDELACLTRDFLVLQTAPREGISMLSGVAADEDVKRLAGKFSSGELVRMLNLIQETVAGFSRSASRRMDAELCIINLCTPQLETDVPSLLARLTKIEDQISTGQFTVMQKTAQEAYTEGAHISAPKAKEPEQNNAEPEPEPTEEPQAPVMIDEAPVGFWNDVVSAVRKELSPAIGGFFGTTPNAPLRGEINGGRLRLLCINKYIVDIINRPDVLEVVSRKASAKLGRPIPVAIVDLENATETGDQMSQLLQFGREHSTIININE
ncbi:MAG: hypothetical protein J6Q54_08755, partial [Oscillospiraceae bacterium]|nr:hypothetical protein [Oscillospiraceae bacterium]